jgi:C-terminal processing protease CtpA/Prc
VEGVCEEGNHTTEYWTSREVSGKRYLERPVYVLTSRHSFSAAEEFAYDLQVLKRATIVGEATGGGANPGTMYRFMNDYQFFVPQARAINATTKTNWDGAGVKPDIPAPADRALQVAHLNTLKSLLPRAATGDRKAEISEAIDKLERETKNK